MRLAVLLLLVACDTSESACEEAAKTTPGLDVGTGETVWQPLAEGDTVGWSFGAQGGRHVYVSLHATGIVQGWSDSLADENNPIVSIVLLDNAPADGADPQVALLNDYPHHFTVTAEGTFEFLGDQVVGMASAWEEIADVDATLRATLTDTCGTELTSERKVTLTENP